MNPRKQLKENSMRKPIVAGNWKMNGNLESIVSLMDGIVSGVDADAATQVIVCSPSIYLPLVAGELIDTAVEFGAQNVSQYESGAYTGEISASMLQDYGCNYAIIGHSERRHIFGETDQDVADKFKKAQEHGITPILCVGELLEEREADQTAEVVIRQIDAVISTCGVEALENAVIAYEPVWAIGTGKTASPEQAQEVHKLIRETISKQNDTIASSLRLLYGGSVKSSNAAELFAMEDIDGGLIGGASLDAKDFLAICAAAN